MYKFNIIDWNSYDVDEEEDSETQYPNKNFIIDIFGKTQDSKTGMQK